ncbi:MlaE family ABC transporter permease [Capnocytophaga sp. ARDL2]|uniref:MlaE family ABC transporter permease n=1 Tax=Capnocytophaga sp. ARDL2 TaxID=3238809 RepID=UPI003559238F
MFLKTVLTNIGKFSLMIVEIFRKPTKWRIMKGLIFKEIDELIIGSLGIVCFLSFFIGAVVSIQTALNLSNPMIPKYLIGFAGRQSILLEFSPTFVSIIMAGRMGSYITSSIGTMRVTEQIDALEVMGINSINYLIFPKLVASLTYPFLIGISMFVGVMGGYIAGTFGGYLSAEEFIKGLQYDFDPYHVTYAFIKTFIFGLVLATVPSFYGYYMQGGALEVGKAATKSFVWTAVTIIILNYLLTQILLT